MQETRDNFFGSKQCSTTLRLTFLLHFGTRAYLFSPDEGSYYIFFYPKQLLRISCILWCYFSKRYQIIISYYVEFFNVVLQHFFRKALHTNLLNVAVEDERNES